MFLDISNISAGKFDITTLTTVKKTARTYPNQGTCVLLPLMPQENYRERIMIIGGSGNACPAKVTQTTPATNTCEILDMDTKPLGWKNVAPMANPRVMPDSVLLPDGTVLVVNGSIKGLADNGIDPVFDAEVYDLKSDKWTKLCPMRVPRLYHSGAILLPDGRVITAGKDQRWNPHEFKYPEYRLEIFSPPYLFAGPRPSILNAPAKFNYGAHLEVTTSDVYVESVALIKPGSVTHSFNHSQRYIGIRIIDRPKKNVLKLEAPPNGYVASPGYYMLFLIGDSGVPSIAKFIQLV